MYRVVNATRQKILAEHAKKTTGFFGRAFGLMFTKTLDQGHGLILDPCSSIHMFWMAYPIDAIFLDKNDRVAALVQEIKPWRTSKVFLQATKCVELPAGAVAASDTRIGDTLIMQVTPKPAEAKGTYLLGLANNARFEVAGDECTVGSDVNNSIQYDLDKSLSPKHFVIRANNGNFTIEDNASRPGTFVNATRIDRPTEIKNGDVIKAGITLFLFEVV